MKSNNNNIYTLFLWYANVCICVYIYIYIQLVELFFFFPFSFPKGLQQNLEWRVFKCCTYPRPHAKPTASNNLSAITTQFFILTEHRHNIWTSTVFLIKKQCKQFFFAVFIRRWFCKQFFYSYWEPSQTRNQHGFFN